MPSPSRISTKEYRQREYWEPVEQGMPWNCSSDLAAAVAYIDDILENGKSRQVGRIKSMFGLESLRDDDFGRWVQGAGSR